MKYVKLAAIILALATCALAQQRGKTNAPKAALAAGGAAKGDAKASGVEIVDRIFERYIEAQGGVAAMMRVKTRVMRATMLFSKSNIPGTLEYYAKAPDKSLAVLNVRDSVQFIEGYDGKTVWLQTPVTGPLVLDQSAVLLDRGSEFGRVRKASEMFASVIYKGKTTVDGRETHLVQVAKAGQTPQLLYFDTQDGLLRRADVQVSKTMVEAAKVTVYFDSYAEVDGVKLPVTIREVYPGYTLTIKVYEVKHNVYIDDALFIIPKSTPAK